MRYAWIDENSGSFPVTAMCRVLDVSKSGFYKWKSPKPSPRRQRSERIRDAVRQVHEQFHGIYGSYKIAQELAHSDDLETACRNTVAKAMQEMGLKSCVRKSFKPTTTVTDKSKKPAENLLEQNFTADAPNQKWVTDITYLPTAQGWVYLAAVMDLFSRRIVGWSISDSLETSLVLAALRNAIETRRPEGRSLVHHSDRGCQYTSDAYQATLKSLGITCSMSRTGCCYDNAVMERFFWSLKHEWTKHRHYENMEQARISVFQYIEAFYNTTRIHQTLNYRSPAQFEESQASSVAA